MLNNYPSFYMDTVIELAGKIGVSDTKIINLCTELGYQGYSGFKRALREEMMSRENEEQDSLETLTDEAKDIAEYAESCIDGLRKTLNDKDNVKAFIKAKDLCGRATKIYFVGFWTFSATAKKIALTYLHHGYLSEAIFPDMGDYIEHLQWVPKGSVAFVFDFPRYITALTEICTFLKEKEVSIVLITDSGPCSRISMADVIVCCRRTGDHIMTGVPEAVIEGVNSTILTLLKDAYPRNVSEYSSSMREAVFTRFNTYGVYEPSEQFHSERI